MNHRPSPSVIALVLLALVAISACSTGSPIRAESGKLRVVAAENTWGSIVRALGGAHATVTSIIRNPATDPHDYEPTPGDARTVASAAYVVENGIGYDAWMQQLIDANPVSRRRVLDVGKLVGVPTGGNPHQWYAPDSVTRVVARVATDLGRLDPGHRAYFDARRTAYEDHELAHYHDRIAAMRGRYAGVPVGASESVVTPLVAALDLRLLTPTALVDAVAEGADPTARDKATADRQIRARQIAVFLFNTQNATPDVTRLVDEARAMDIPVVSVTETLEPASATFTAWQIRQLDALASALAKATGR